MKLYKIFFLLLCSVSLKAQTAIKGVVKDLETQEPLEAVSIYIEAKNTGVISDASGKFNISINNFPVKISFSHIGYESLEINLTKKPKQDLTIFLSKTIQILPEAIVSSRRPIDTLFQEPYSVTDYEFYNEYILVLAYKNVKSKYSLILLDENGERLDELNLSEKKPEALHKSCLGKIHLLTALNAHEISVYDQAIALEPKIDKALFNAVLKPCIVQADEFLVFKKYYYQGLALQYVGLKPDSTQQEIITIVDERHIDWLLEDMGLFSKNKGEYMSKKIHPDVLQVRQMPRPQSAELEVFYPKVYAPIVKKKDSLIVFNHIGGNINIFHENNSTQIPVNYHKDKKWMKKIYYDSYDDRAFTAFHSQWGEIIREINLEDGSLGPGIELDRAFIEKPKLKEGYIYFIHRNNKMENQNRMLHKMPLD